MQFIITARDGENMLEHRMRVRPGHLENMARLGGSVVCAGGLLNGAGQPVGSVLIVDFPSREQVDEYLQNEPYVREKVWREITVEPMNVVIVRGEKVGK